ncbi:MAG: hypothetical protein PHY99_03440 [Bacteroidales bacterium]|nr:hypothetical protein [Bacteroidales bacterium]
MKIIVIIPLVLLTYAILFYIWYQYRRKETNKGKRRNYLLKMIALAAIVSLCFLAWLI